MTKVVAEMAATVWKVLVEPGDTVRAADTVVILESMKMELPIAAGADGVVRRVHVIDGEIVGDGSLMVEIDS